MTNNEIPEDAGGGKPDGYVVVHTPKGGGDRYVIGPYPPIPELIERIVKGGICECQREALPAAFPNGIVMGFDVEQMMPGLVQAVAATINSSDDEPIH